MEKGWKGCSVKSMSSQVPFSKGLAYRAAWPVSCAGHVLDFFYCEVNADAHPSDEDIESEAENDAIRRNGMQPITRQLRPVLGVKDGDFLFDGYLMECRTIMGVIDC